MLDVITKRLEQFGTLTPREKGLLKTLCVNKPRLTAARQIVKPNGSGTVPFVIGGWICTFGQLRDGRRQVIDLMVPGDLGFFGDSSLPHARPLLQALTEAVVLDIPADRLRTLSAASLNLGKAIRTSKLVQSAIAREWVLSLGVRKAKERCAHLICEMFWRLGAMDLTRDGWFDFPLTQDEVGCTIGVTTVHANRMLQDLRAEGLIEQRRRKMRVVDQRGLEQLALFNPDFLYLSADSRSAQAMPVAIRGLAQRDRSYSHGAGRYDDASAV